jgi:hypothetical protein
MNENRWRRADLGWSQIYSWMERNPNLALTMAMFYLCAAATVAIFQLWPSHGGPPLRYRYAEAVNSPVVPGGTLYVHTMVDKNRACDVTVTRWITLDAEGTIVAALPGQGTFYDVGEGIERTIPHEVPSGIKPGRYRLEMLHNYDCHDGAYLVRAPDLYFTVGAPDAPAEAPRPQQPAAPAR